MAENKQYKQLCWTCSKITCKHECIWARSGGRRLPKGAEQDKDSYIISCPNYSKDSSTATTYARYLKDKYKLSDLEYRNYQYSYGKLIKSLKNLSLSLQEYIEYQERNKQEKQHIYEDLGLSYSQYRWAIQNYNARETLQSKYPTLYDYLMHLANRNIKPIKKESKEIKPKKPKLKELAQLYNLKYPTCVKWYAEFSKQKQINNFEAFVKMKREKAKEPTLKELAYSYGINYSTFIKLKYEFNFQNEITDFDIYIEKWKNKNENVTFRSLTDL